jgi:hypothetical protein
MGNSSYSVENRTFRATTLGYDTKPKEQIFIQKTVHNEMSPKDIELRESCDSEENPNSVPIVIGLDVTGSMGNVPHALVKDGLPKLMSSVIQHGTPDPAVLFLAIGDHECDRHPLQVGQFESGDEELDNWLTTTYLEGGGGGNGGESYLLAWYFAGYHTATDAMDKRSEKGFLFTIGDEPNLKTLPVANGKEIMGSTYSAQDVITAEQCLNAAKDMYRVYHIHIKETYAGSKQSTIDGWKQILGDRVLVAESHKDVATIIAETIISHKQDKKVKTDNNQIIL